MIQSSSNECYIFKLFNMAGQEVFNESSKLIPGDNMHNLNLAGFHKGIYILEIQGNGFSKYISLIIH